MTRNLNLILAVMAFASASAQAPFATAFKDPGLAHNFAHDYAQLARAFNGDAILVQDLSETTGDRYIYAVRTAADGTLQWMMRHQAVGGELWDVTDMALSPNGSIVITGTDGLHGMFMRLDAAGALMAAKWYSWTGNSAATALQVLNDTAIVLFGNNRQGGTSRGWSVVVDENGDLETSAVSFQVDGFELAATQALPLPGAKAMLFGRSDVIGLPFQNAVAAGVVDSTGNVLWGARFTGAGLVLRPIGAMVLADGSARLLVRNDGGFTSQSTIVIALDPAGVVLWMKELHPKRGAWDLTGLALVPMSDTTMAITGFYDPVHSGALLIDTAANVLGHESWNLVISANEGYRDLGGELVLGAHTPVSGSFDPAIMRTYPDLHLCTATATTNTTNTTTLDVVYAHGTAAQSLSVVNILPDFTSVAIAPVLNQMCITLDVGQYTDPVQGVLIAPNPARDRVTISGQALETVEVFDATGRAMLIRSFQGETMAEIDLGPLASGIYHVRTKSGQNWHNSKLIKE